MKAKKTKLSLSNILFGVFIVLMMIPQSRQFIQIQLQKGLSLFSPSIEDEDEQIQLQTYQWKLQDINGDIYD
ncbi:MAG TPA: TlpA family protein disulfide reductase, partial [Flavobacteriaceae bacterium]|nr:TlpA family protein disulfide reductase [Flavobacteriaceae bacterium]